MKKMVSFFITLVLLMSVANGVSAKDGKEVAPLYETKLNLSSAEISRFEGLGFTQRQIQDMEKPEYLMYDGVSGSGVSKTTFVSLFDTNGNERVYSSEQWDNVTKKDPELLKAGNYLTTTLIATNLGGKEFLLKYDWEWNTTPVIVLKDVMAITHTNSVAQISGSEYAVYQYDDFGTNVTNTDYYWTADVQNAFGMAFEFDLIGKYFTGGSTNWRGHMAFRVNATPNNFEGWANVYGHYAHKIFSPGAGFSIGSGGPSFSVTPSFSWDKATDTNQSFYIS